MEILILTISSIILIIDIIIYQKNRKFLKCKITSDNKIRFFKLKKKYLNNINLNEYSQLLNYLYNDYLKRCKNE